jgi:hypothetical protein
MNWMTDAGLERTVIEVDRDLGEGGLGEELNGNSNGVKQLH